MMNHMWHERFLKLAGHISRWSKDPSTKVGAVIVDPSNRNLLSIGYNGFPKGIDDDKRYLNRELKYPLVVHAEMNAIYNATHNGVSLKDSILYVHGLPVCADCSKGVIQVGIKMVVMEADVIPDHWASSWECSKKIFDEARVEYLFI